MAQTGREHWRRAVLCTFAGIFVVSLVAGLVGSITSGGALSVAPATGHPSLHAPAPTTGTPATTTTLPVSPRTAARAQRALLQLSDLPAGWVAGAAASAPVRLSPWSAPLAGCVGVGAHTATVAPTKVDSPDFTSADKELAVEDSVSVYPSAAAARAQYAAVASARTTRCMTALAGPTLQASMQHSATTGTTIGTVSFVALPAGAAAQHETGYTVSIPVADNGRVLAITSTQVDFVHGALLHQVTFNGNGMTFPPTLEIELLTAAQKQS